MGASNGTAGDRRPSLLSPDDMRALDVVIRDEQPAGDTLCVHEHARSWLVALACRQPVGALGREMVAEQRLWGLRAWAQAQRQRVTTMPETPEEWDAFEAVLEVLDVVDTAEQQVRADAPANRWGEEPVSEDEDLSVTLILPTPTQMTRVH